MPLTQLPMGERALALIRHEALVGGVANAVINGALGAWMLAGKGPHPLTVDSIAEKAHTVLGSAVTLALTLGLVVGSLTFFTFRRKARAQGLAPEARLARAYWPFGALQALGAAVTMAAYVALVAVLWQRWMGTVAVATPVAAAISGVVAGVTAWFVTRRTARALIHPL